MRGLSLFAFSQSSSWIMLLLPMIKVAFLCEIVFPFPLNQQQHHNQVWKTANSNLILTRRGDNRRHKNTYLWASFLEKNDEDEKTNNDDSNDDDGGKNWILPAYTENDDWHSFRAKLVLREEEQAKRISRTRSAINILVHNDNIYLPSLSRITEKLQLKILRMSFVDFLNLFIFVNISVGLYFLTCILNTLQ